MDIRFFPAQRVKDSYSEEDYYRVFVNRDNWNDYGYQTTCDILVLAPNLTEPQYIGSTRIAYLGQLPKDLWVFENDPTEFSDLRKKDSAYFSVSNSVKFYEALVEIGEEFALNFLMKICDVIFDNTKWEKYKSEEVFKTSLMRSRAKILQIRDEFPSLFGNQSDIVSKFGYEVTLEGADASHKLKFDFSVDEIFPYRVNLITGINGTGKTQIFSKLALALTGFISKNEESNREKADDLDRRKIMAAGAFSIEPSFYGAIAVSFSAFDDFEIPNKKPLQENSFEKFRYSYCGLRAGDETLKDAVMLLSEMKEITSDLSKPKRIQLRRALKDVFTDHDFNFLFFQDEIEPFESSEVDDDMLAYQALSAGQRVILNIIVHLACRLSRRTLVLLDEPETHLHPMLMATLITTINSLLEANDSYAIIASHSPIIAQQIPSSRIQILGRDRNYPFTHEPPIECFGENLSIITSALYGAVEGERDYTTVIDDALDSEDGIASFEQRMDELGTNARMYLKSKLREL